MHILPHGQSWVSTITLAHLSDDLEVKWIPIDYYERKGKSKFRPVQDTYNYLMLVLRTVMSQSEHIHLQVVKPSDEIPANLEKIQGVLAVRPTQADTFEIETTLNNDRRAEIAEMAVQRGWGVLELRPVRLSLEDVFLQLTMQEDETDYTNDSKEGLDG